MKTYQRKHEKTGQSPVFSFSNGCHTHPYFNFQISLLYSAIVLSEEKNPAFAMFTNIIFLHFFWSS